MTISLDWTLKDGATEEDAMDYAVELVKNFNDIIAVQTTDLEASSDTSFGSLWDTFSLDLTDRYGGRNGSFREKLRRG